MGSPTTIPCFEDKFAKFTINKSPTRKKKVYPQHLYPNGTPPETTPRAGSRPVFGPSTPSRNISKSKSFSTVKKPLEKRLLSYPMSETSSSKQDYQFSFMKETTSSLQKKQNSSSKIQSLGPIPSSLDPSNVSMSTSGSIPRSTSTNASLTSSASMGSISTLSTPVSTTKKRNEYSRQLSQSLRSRRMVSNNCPPSDITNLPYHPSSTKDLGDSPSKTKVFRNSSQPLPLKKSDVFNRLYPGPVKTERVLHQPQTRSKPPQSQTSSSATQSQSLDPRLSPKDTPKKPKIRTITELYYLLNKIDPSLFRLEEIDGVPQGEEPKESVPLDPAKIKNTSLNDYEKEEISRKKDIYFIPTVPSTRQINIKNYQNNFGFDDPQGNYLVAPHDHVNFRFEILSTLGNGSFGKVIRVRDHKWNKVVAIKIIKNDLNWSLQSLNEIKLLKLLNGADGTSTSTSPFILKYFDHFNFRSHICIVSELLTINLYSLLELTEFKGLSLDIVQKMGIQMLKGMKFLHASNIIHCDIKPENIMLKLPSGPESRDLEVKIIDFGSSCFKKETAYTYIQSRFYRAPEIIIGSTYSEKIDIWSFGCILSELYTGLPLLPGKNEFEQIGLILELFGAPKSSTVLRQRNVLKKQASKNFEQPSFNDRSIKKLLLFKLFDINGRLNLSLLNYYSANSNSSATSGVPKKFKLSSKSLDTSLSLAKYENDLNGPFLGALNKIFVWDPAERSTVEDLLSDPFFKESD